MNLVLPDHREFSEDDLHKIRDNAVEAWYKAERKEELALRKKAEAATTIQVCDGRIRLLGIFNRAEGGQT